MPTPAYERNFLSNWQRPPSTLHRMIQQCISIFRTNFIYFSIVGIKLSNLIHCKQTKKLPFSGDITKNNTRIKERDFYSIKRYEVQKGINI